jgi:hypothetical protein
MVAVVEEEKEEGVVLRRRRLKLTTQRNVQRRKNGDAFFCQRLFFFFHCHPRHTRTFIHSHPLEAVRIERGQLLRNTHTISSFEDRCRLLSFFFRIQAHTAAAA